jgi:hypothetical protein
MKLCSQALKKAGGDRDKNRSAAAALEDDELNSK